MYENHRNIEKKVYMKILVNIFVPSISENYDVLVPDFLPVKEVTTLISEAVEYLSNRRYVSSKQEFICLVEQEVLLREDLTLRDYNVRNGDHLVIM